MYTATTEGNYIKIIDIKTGATKRRIRFGGTIVQGPVVTENEFSITVRHSAQLQYVLIYNLPSGTLKRRVRI